MSELPLPELPEHPFAVQARTYLGVPWQHQGRTRSGVDCVGLPVCVARDRGRELQDRTDYHRDPHSKMFRAHVEQELGAPLPRAQWWVTGQIAMMRTVVHPHHLAILARHETGCFSIIHAHGGHKKVIETVLDEQLRRCIMAVFRSPA